MSKQKRGRGRPPKFNGNQSRHIASLVKEYGLTGAKNVLESDERNTNLFPESLTVTLPTIRKCANDNGVGKLQRGRRAA